MTSRRIEDFDEFCDPDNPREIKYDAVLEAAANITTSVIKTNCLPSHYQSQFVMRLYYKLEMLQRAGSFKDRGALNVLAKMPLDKKKIGVVVASIGNEAISLCYHTVRQGVPTIVVMPITVPISKLQRCHSMGAKVVVQGCNLMEAQKYARAIARDKGLTYINGRDHPDVLAGYGTMALEILNEVPWVEAVIVPVGTGGLAAAVATVIKHDKPDCLVYGVQTEASPVFFNSLNDGEPQLTPINPTMADSIAVSQVGINSFVNAQPLLDKMLLVKDDWIARAMLHLMEKERLVVEAAGACPLATIFGNLVPELKLKTHTRLFNSLLSPVMFVYVVTCSLMLCTIAYNLTSTTTDSPQRVYMFEYLMYVLTQLILFTWHGHEVLIKSQDLIHGPYESEWWAATPRQRKMLLLLTGQFRQDYTLTAGPFTDLSLSTFLWVGVVCILSGGNNDTLLYSRCLERGLSAEGRLVKFRVGIKDSSCAQAQLLKLIAAAGYNVVQHFQHHKWMHEDVYRLEMILTCMTRNLAHALELKRIIERAYPCTVTFETEPFNDKRTCPCYVWKPIKPVL